MPAYTIPIVLVGIGVLLVVIWSIAHPVFVRCRQRLQYQEDVHAHFARLQQCFLAFTPDPLENIRILTALCGEVLHADCALYNRLVDGQLVAWGQWQTPADFLAVDNPVGHICTDVIRQHREDVMLIRNLPQTSYADSDPNVARYQLQTYLGHSVSLGDLPVGSLCTVYTGDFVPTESERALFSIIATAIGIEESRKHANDLLVIQRDLEQQLAGKHDLQAALQRCLDTAIRVSGMDSGGIYLLDSASSTLELVASQGLPEQFRQAVHAYPLDSDRGRLLSAGQAIYTAYDELRLAPSPETVGEGLRSIGIIPIQIGDVLLGSINVASHSATKIYANARVTLEVIAGQIGSVVTRLRTTVMLQQREVELTSFFDTITDFLFVLDDTGRILRVNTAVVQRLGYTENELLGQSVLLIHPPDRREEAQRIVLAMLAGERACCPVPLQAKNGTLIPVETRVTSGNLGNLQILVGISRDITERQQAEEALRNSEARLRTLLDTLPDLVWLKDPHGVYLACNPRFEQFFGASEAEIVGKTDYDFVEAPLGDFFRERDRAVIEAGRACMNEETIVFASDGHQEHLETTKTPMYGSQGELLGVLGIAHDISDRKQHQQALTYRLAFEDLIASLSTQFINCQVTQIDQEITRTLGVIGTFMRADRAYVFTFSTDQSFMNNSHEWCAEGIAPEIDNLQQLPLDTFPWWMTRLRAHETIHVPRVADMPPEAETERAILQAQCIQSVAVIPLCEEGQVIGFLGFDAVQEERKWTDEAVRLLTMVGDLVVNALARKRTGEQMHGLQIALQQRIHELRAANQELEAFTYSVSHDLRAPLWNITSFADALEEDDGLVTSAETRDLIVRIQQASQRMTALIDALLMLSRLTRESITLIPCSLSAMVQESAVALQQANPARDATITITPDIQITADPRLLRIALTNLLENAWKYTSKRDHAIITFGVLEQGEETVYYIQDNGAGFNMAHRERLFTPFQRLHRERDYPGTGIGLATVQRIIHRHGGRIWADGQIGHGATFYFTLNTAAIPIATTETRA